MAALGVDTASIDHGPSRDFIVHQIVNGANIPGLENVAHLDKLPEWGAWVIALPMKIGGGSGGARPRGPRAKPDLTWLLRGEESEFVTLRT